MIESRVLPQNVLDTIVPYVEKLKKIHGANLLSVFVYGSATSQNFIAASSDINSVFIFKKIDLKVLSNSLACISQGLKKKISAPLFMTSEDIVPSLDVFPIEFLEMQESCVVVYGENILADLKVDPAHIRIFCEQQIKGKLIRLRQSYLEIGLQHKQVRSLLKETLNTLFPIFRNVLRLRNRVPPTDKKEIIQHVCAEFELAENALLAIYKDKTGEAVLAPRLLAEHYAAFMDELARLAQKVDAL